MSITSGSFLLFALALTVLYFLVPKHGQWMLLLLASAVFYCAAGLQYGAYILFTALSTYCGARWIGRLAAQQQAYLKANKEQLSREEKKAYKAGNKARRKAVMIAALLLNFGLLAVFKYGDFVLTQLNRAAALLGSGPVHGPLGLIAPLGISFYTFQSMGYLVDVYWEKCAPEKNIARMLLFVSFFPQIIQGPISNFSQLAPQLYAPHSFSAARLGSGLQRMLWGFFKKLVIADTLAPYVQAVFANYTEYSGVAVLVGAFLYSAQIYADFSGYMDIVCGLCEIWGIQLAENFQRPYFSKSIAEYWRRWHITLGEWFKTYLYYPVAVSHFARNAGKRWQKRFGGSVGKTIPATVALLIVWLTTGLWHGASWAYIAWGGVNGAFIIFSLWMEPSLSALEAGAAYPGGSLALARVPDPANLLLGDGHQGPAGGRRPAPGAGPLEAGRDKLASAGDVAGAVSLCRYLDQSGGDRRRSGFDAGCQPAAAQAAGACFPDGKADGAALYDLFCVTGGDPALWLLRRRL